MAVQAEDAKVEIKKIIIIIKKEAKKGKEKNIPWNKLYKYTTEDSKPESVDNNWQRPWQANQLGCTGNGDHA
jgi:hypothetical protein